MRHPWDQVKVVGAVVRALTAMALLLFFAVTPKRGEIFHVVLWLHRTAFFSLFAFLSIAQFLQFQAWWQIRQERPSQCLAATLQRLWTLTEIAPAPIALIIFLTGLRLIWEKPAKNAPSELWLSALIASFSVFFFDGIVGYQPAVRKMLRYWSHAAKENVPVSVAAQAWNATSDSVQLFLHFLSWPFVFTFGVLRPSQPNPIGPAIARFQSQVLFLPAGWPEVISAFALWALIGAFVLLVRTFLRPLHPQKGEDALGVSWWSNRPLKTGTGLDDSVGAEGAKSELSQRGTSFTGRDRKTGAFRS